jgi:hypothetical protein
VSNVKFSKLRYEYSATSRWKLTSVLYYFHDEGTITVPIGFETDGDSVPRFPIVYLVFKGRATKSAVVHDYLYFSQLGKAYADSLFLEAMKDEGVALRWRYPIYWAVVVLGHSSYRKHAS